MSALTFDTGGSKGLVTAVRNTLSIYLTSTGGLTNEKSYVYAYWYCRPHLYGKYNFSTEAVNSCLELAEMGIFLAAWLAAAARTEMARFIEFMHFLRYGTKLLSTLFARRINDRYSV